MIKVLSLGGSIIAPEQPDTDFLEKFNALIRAYLDRDSNRKLIIVTGGGGPARIYQNSYKKIINESLNDQADWIGIMATRLNAQLIKAVFADICPGPVVYNPTETGIVLLAERYSGPPVITRTNTEKLYTDDPQKNPAAKPIDSISWTDFRKMIGDEWIPGKNVPFDPIASRHAEKAGIKVICASGRNVENLENILEERPFIGTVIG